MGRGEGDSAEEEGKQGSGFLGEFLDTVDRVDEWEICGVKDCVAGEYTTHTILRTEHELVHPLYYF